MSALAQRLLCGVLALWFACAATLAADDGNWKKELARDFDNIGKARKNQAQLHRGLVDKWRAANHLDDALAEYEARIEKAPDDALLRYASGYAYAVRGDAEGYEQARARFQQATELDPAFTLAFFSLGGVLYQLRRLDDALVAYENCVRLDPTYVSAHYARGEIYRAKSEWTPALESYDLAIANATQDWARPHFGRAVVFAAQGYDTEADIEFTNALRLDPSFAATYYQLGQLRVRQGRFAEALDLYRLGAEKGAPSGDDLRNLGSLLLSKAQYADAERFLRQATQRDPQNADAHFDLGEALWALDRREEAVTSYRHAIALDPARSTAFTNRVRDDFFVAKMTPAEARLALDKALALNAEDAEAHVLYAQVETASANVDAALSHYETAARLDPNRDDLALPTGDLYFATGDAAQAATAYREHIRRNPADADRFLVAGRSAFQDGRFDDARALFSKHLLVAPDDASARYQLARCLESLDDAVAAIAEYERVRDAAPDTGDTLIRLAELYRKTDQPQKALAAVDQFVASHPDDAPALTTRARLLFELDRRDEATVAYERVVALKPDDADAYRTLAALYEKSDKTKAISAYRRLTELTPTNVEPYLKLSALLLERGDEESVIPLYAKALEIEPRRANEQMALARMLAKRNRWEEAVPHFLIAVEIRPEDGTWQYEAARAAHRVALTTESTTIRDALVEKADAAYSATIRLQPSGDAFYYRGLLRREYKQAGERLFLSSEIADDFKQALAFKPTNTDARFYLAQTYLDMEATDLAETAFRELLKVAPKYPNANAALGKIAEERNDFKGAIGFYQREIAANPKSAFAHYRYGVLAANSQGDMQTGMKQLEQALALDPNHVNARIEYAMILYRVDRIAAAADHFERALKLDPKNLTANYNLALMYQYLDKRRLAVERWRYLLTLDLPGEWRAEVQQYLNELERN
jgi:tetratricopeptide (TPR) repeat protein